jgi:hypothetical protein
MITIMQVTTVLTELLQGLQDSHRPCNCDALPIRDDSSRRVLQRDDYPVYDSKMHQSCRLLCLQVNTRDFVLTRKHNCRFHQCTIAVHRSITYVYNMNSIVQVL